MGAYDELLERVKKVSNVQSAEGVLRWDQEVMMPAGGTPARSRQLSTLSSIAHGLMTDERMGDLLDELEGEDLSPEQAAAVREIRRGYERSIAVPNELVERMSQATSEALEAWEEAKEKSDWEIFAPHLTELRDLELERANHIDPDQDPYAVLFHDYEPYIPLEEAAEVLEALRKELVPLLEAIRESDVNVPDDPIRGTFPEEVQRELCDHILDMVGFDRNRGRLDTSAHPFTRGNQFDARITTRFNDENVLETITSTIHEFGHALYSLNLPGEHYGTPLGCSRELTVHESQSRFWENHVGKSRAFWEMFAPTVREHFSDFDADPENVFRAVNRVDPGNPIRVEADEVSYHLHIILRFEIEQQLINEKIDVEEVPALWNEKSVDYLGVRPQRTADGALQDIHWSHGSFGYFPTYSLGSVLAAQVNRAMEQDLDVSALIRAKQFGDIHDWLKEKVHKHGQRYTTQELITRATGEELNPEHFLDYVSGKYTEIYGL